MSGIFKSRIFRNRPPRVLNPKPPRSPSTPIFSEPRHFWASDVFTGLQVWDESLRIPWIRGVEAGIACKRRDGDSSFAEPLPQGPKLCLNLPLF